MKVKELKRRLDEFGTGIDECDVVLTRYTGTGRLQIFIPDEESQFTLKTTEATLLIAIG